MRLAPPFTAAVTVTSRFVIPSAIEVCRPAAGSASTERLITPPDTLLNTDLPTSVIDTAVELIV